MARHINNHHGAYIDENHHDEYGTDSSVRAELNHIRKAYNTGLDIKDEQSPSYRRGRAFRDFI
jgi:hypothetical protein